MGGMNALGGSTEYQGSGTPHLHTEGHVVCAYQFDTMQEIEDNFRSKKISVEAWKHYQSWLHHEDVFVPTEHAAFADKVQDEFFDCFRKREHAGLSQVPAFLVEDAVLQAAEGTLTVSSCTTPTQRQALQDDANAFMQSYTSDLQYVFNRAQHHVHKKKLARDLYL